MSARRITLIGGGTRSGKSDCALQLARTRGQRRVFVATAQAFDAEMSTRIAAHVRTRGSDFRTVEQPLELVQVLAALRDADVVVVDCLTLWLSNLLLRGDTPADIEAQIHELARVLQRRGAHTLLVTNEVGMGVVPESALGRTFRDLSGLANQRMAAVADEIYWAMLGTVLRIRPDPISVHVPGSVA
jgi:adenosylcobinamide kinase/adenosylcobinamide-phosphate guanylyltransferase